MVRELPASNFFEHVTSLQSSFAEKSLFDAQVPSMPALTACMRQTGMRAETDFSIRAASLEMSSSAVGCVGCVL